jgi:hypothetical protein
MQAVHMCSAALHGPCKRARSRVCDTYQNAGSNVVDCWFWPNRDTCRWAGTTGGTQSDRHEGVQKSSSYAQCPALVTAALLCCHMQPRICCGCMHNCGCRAHGRLPAPTCCSVLRPWHSPASECLHAACPPRVSHPPHTCDPCAGQRRSSCPGHAGSSSSSSSSSSEAGLISVLV